MTDKPTVAEAMARAEIRSNAIRDFCAKIGIEPLIEIAGLPDDVRRWRMNSAVSDIEKRRAARREQKEGGE